MITTPQVQPLSLKGRKERVALLDSFIDLPPPPRYKLCLSHQGQPTGGLLFLSAPFRHRTLKQVPKEYLVFLMIHADLTTKRGRNFCSLVRAEYALR